MIYKVENYIFAENFTVNNKTITKTVAPLSQYKKDWSAFTVVKEITLYHNKN